MAKSVSRLKEEARRAEKRENWSRAIRLYTEALELSEERGDLSLDLSLYNRVGDLHRRQGDAEAAIRCYFQAVEQYADQGLHTGAIALCNKILRLDPDEVDVYRVLGRLQAATGLVAEARNSFREYAERMEEAGDTAARRDALLELAHLVDDHQLLSQTLEEALAAGQEEVARERLLRIREERDGDGELGRRVRAGLEELAPDVVGAGDEPETDRTADAPAEEPGTADGGDAEARTDVAAPEAAPAREEDGTPEADTPSPGDEAAVAEEAADETGEDAAVEEGAPGDAEVVTASEGPAPTVHDGEDDGERDEGGPGAGGVDLGERIRERLAEAHGEAGGVPDASRRAIDDMLVGFRAQAEATAGEADPETHVEFGVALRQMGRVDDAIREFQTAARCPDPPLRAFELLGECFLRRDQHSVAVRVLNRALRLPGRSDSELLGVLHQLGVAYQVEERWEEALDCFERVYSVDIDFRDVADRMEAVRMEA